MDFQSPKLLIPAVLFALLSPGILLSLPSTTFASGQTNLLSVLIHALVLVVLYWALLKYALGVSFTKADLVVPAVLFLLLSPDVLVTIPPGAIMSGTTSTTAVAVHTVVFALVFGLLRSSFPQYY